MNIPFTKQINNYTCGPAALQMVLAYFGKHVSQKTLAREAKTSKAHGTENEDLIRAATENGLHCYVNNRATPEEIIHFLSIGLPVIVNFIEPSKGEGHFAVVTGCTQKTITLNDPWNGKGFTMPTEEFIARWYDEGGKYPQWIMVLSETSFAPPGGRA